MRIYLDNCSFNRPFDDQEQIKIKLETEAKLYIQHQILTKKIELAWSYILDYENEVNPFAERRKIICEWKRYSSVHILESPGVLTRANIFHKNNIRVKDALHLASAIEAGCDYFITTDEGLIKKRNTIKEIDIINPITYIQIEKE